MVLLELKNARKYINVHLIHTSNSKRLTLLISVFVKTMNDYSSIYTNHAYWVDKLLEESRTCDKALSNRLILNSYSYPYKLPCPTYEMWPEYPGSIHGRGATFYIVSFVVIYNSNGEHDKISMS